jgi:hypothetical protein
MLPSTVAARSKAWTVFARSNTGIVGSNPTRGMDVCVRSFCVCVVLCVGWGLATRWSSVQGVPPTMYRLRNWKSGQGTKGCRAMYIYMLGGFYHSRSSWGRCESFTTFEDCLLGNIWRNRKYWVKITNCEAFRCVTLVFLLLFCLS